MTYGVATCNGNIPTFKENTMRNPVFLAVLITLITSTPAVAQFDLQFPLRLAQSTQGTPAPMVNGEVLKVDKDAGKITLKHDAIPNLEMPGMSMVFSVKDATMLGKVKPGDKVRFAADKVGGAITIIQIEPAK